MMHRAKLKHEDNWIQGSLIQYNDRAFIHEEKAPVIKTKVKEDTCILDLVAFEVNPDTICMAVGQEDKNKTPLWEKDIVKVPGEDSYFVVSWEDDTARFVLESEDLIVDFDNYWSYELEVVGNMTDQPELVNGNYEMDEIERNSI